MIFQSGSVCWTKQLTTLLWWGQKRSHIHFMQWVILDPLEVVVCNKSSEFCIISFETSTGVNTCLQIWYADLEMCWWPSILPSRPEFQKKLPITTAASMVRNSLLQWFPQDERRRGTFWWISSLNGKLLWSTLQSTMCKYWIMSCFQVPHFVSATKKCH